MEFENLAIKGRFTPERQAQIDGIISYLFTLGLDGRDLIAIGGKIERERQRQNIDSLKKIIASYEVTLFDDDNNPFPLSYKYASQNARKFQLTVNGTEYLFHIQDERRIYGWATVAVTKQSKNANAEVYSVSWIENAYKLHPRMPRRTSLDMIRNSIILDVHAGMFKLPV